MNAIALLIALLVIPLFWALGRLAVARLLRIPVLRVSWGLWGRVAGFERRGVEYRIGCVPIGAYVKIKNNAEDVGKSDRGGGDEPTDARLPSIWRRLLLFPAGPVSVLLLGLFSLSIHSLLSTSDTMPPAIVGKVFAGSPADQAGLRSGDRIGPVQSEANGWPTTDLFLVSRTERPMV
jgi:regulator of sigma E protease